MKLTEQPVDWAGEIWDDLLEILDKGNNRARSIAAQVSCNLAKSDTDNRMADTPPKLLQATKWIRGQVVFRAFDAFRAIRLAVVRWIPKCRAIWEMGNGVGTGLIVPLRQARKASNLVRPLSYMSFYGCRW